MPAVGHVPGLVPERSSRARGSARCARTSSSRCGTTVTATSRWRAGSRTSAASSVRILDYGKTESAPFYEPMYEALEAAGYTRDQNVRVAGYDARLTPDMDGFLAAHEAADREHVPRERPHAGAPRRPLERPALRAVPAHAHVSGPGRTSTSTASRRSPATSPARGSSTRCSSPGSTSQDFSFPATVANAREQRPHVPHRALELHERRATRAIFRGPRPSCEDASTGRSYTPQGLPAPVPRCRAGLGRTRSPTTTSGS